MIKNIYRVSTKPPSYECNYLFFLYFERGRCHADQRPAQLIGQKHERLIHEFGDQNQVEASPNLSDEVTWRQVALGLSGRFGSLPPELVEGV